MDLLKKALWIWENTLGTNHSKTATIYYNIGIVYLMQGNYREALQWLEKALAVRVNVLGAEHPLTKITQKWVDCTKQRLSSEE